MKNTHLNGLRLVALLVLCFTVLSACATSPASQADLFAHKDTNPLDRATIDAVGDKVAEWQIANLKYSMAISKKMIQKISMLTP